ncbi:HpcH/HpaI aldolase family protein [Subtercola endophyticus]|uniref:HpcH/HpaI aldolase family protein n=1 Tax=Subtercola endophyticus TaxID=2895559 RepID=UPI001E336E1F|nr:aldolase/citrate lyase family protein [Subtercola endophyticus]UFS58766.1 aldolase/citrate lyase family protein [Subtercola endophyticus]
MTIQLPSADAVELVGLTGYDFAWIDAEHGTLDLSDINALIRAADAVDIDAIVRVPDHNPSFIQRVLDAGATGIMAPHIRTLEDARAIVAAAKFSPEGIRGACPSTRGVGHLALDWKKTYRTANDDVLVFGLIEDIEGVENVESIAKESGLDGLVFGPFDLSMALGLEGDVAHPQIEAMHTRVIEAARDAGIQYIAIPSWEFGGYEKLIANGVRMFNVTGDRGALYMSFMGALAESRAKIAEQTTIAEQPKAAEQTDLVGANR